MLSQHLYYILFQPLTNISYTGPSPLNSTESVGSVAVVLSSNFANGLFESCKDVQFPSNNQKVRYTLYSILCILYSVFYTLYSILCILYSVLYTLYSILCILYSVFYTLYSVFYTLYSILYTLYTILCILYSILCILYSISCTPSDKQQPNLVNVNHHN